MKKLIIKIALVLVVLISLFLGCFFSRILPLGFGFAILIFFPSILVIGFLHNKISIKRKNTHFLSFYTLLYILAVVAGFATELYAINKAKETLLNANAIILKYKSDNNCRFLSEDDFKYIILPKGINVEVVGDSVYFLNYKDSSFGLDSKSNTVSDRVHCAFAGRPVPLW